MRRGPLAVIGLLLSTTSANASAPAPIREKSTACVVSVEKNKLGKGYRLSRLCDTPALTNKAASSLAMAQASTGAGGAIDGDEDAGGGSALSVPMAVLAAGAIGAGIYIAVDDGEDRDLPSGP